MITEVCVIWSSCDRILESESKGGVASEDEDSRVGDAICFDTVREDTSTADISDGTEGGGEATGSDRRREGGGVDAGRGEGG